MGLADELDDARTRRLATVSPPSARGDGFDLDAAYVVERELSRRRQAEGRRVVGRKVGYANKAVWRALKLETLVWADMYDDTVRHAPDNDAPFSMAALIAPKVEPEIVFRLRTTVPIGTTDAAAVLGAVEWIALGFEIVDCPYPDWTFQPADFVASCGLHAALVVGAPIYVDAENASALAEALPAFALSLSRNGEPAERGSGRNALRSPALCLAELATAISRRAGAAPLVAGELVSSGTLTESRLVAPGDTWRAEVEGLELPPLTLRVTA